MPKIVFLNPPLTTEDRYGVKSQSGGQTPPLGLAYLAAMTRKEGFDTHIVDAAALNLNCEKAAEMIIQHTPDFLGLTGATIAIHNAARVARRVKEKLPEIKVIAGGPHFTALPDQTMELFPVIDIGCMGEGDVTIVELLQAMETDRNLLEVDGLVLRRNGGLHFTSARQRIQNLDELPIPAWDLLPNLAEFYCPPVHTLKKIPAALLVTSRGCPGQCTFCDRSIYGNKCTFNSAGYVMKMVDDLFHNYGIGEIQFRDDNFVAFKRRLIELCGLIKDSGLDIVWSCAGRADMVTPELLNVMRDAGCWQIWYGIETGSQRILDVINKKLTLERIERAVKWTNEAGIAACGFFMIGHPTETKKTMDQTISFATKMPLQESHFAFVTPFPGSELYKDAEMYGSFENDWQRMNGWRPVFIPKGLQRNDLEHYAKRAFRRFYFRPRIVVNYLRKIKSAKLLKAYFNGFKALSEYLVKKRK